MSHIRDFIRKVFRRRNYRIDPRQREVLVAAFWKITQLRDGLALAFTPVSDPAQLRHLNEAILLMNHALWPDTYAQYSHDGLWPNQTEYEKFGVK